MTVSAIDISHYQGAPDFNAIRAAGVGLVMMKATDGLNGVDPQLGANRAGASAAGLTKGYYHFARATNASSEAAHFCDTVGSLDHGDLVALDWEVSGGDPVGWSLAFLKTVEARFGVKPLIYLNKSTVAGFDWSPVVSNDNGLWLASYDYNSATVPNVAHWSNVSIKQFSDKGTVHGVNGAVDLDTFEGSADALAKYGFGGGVAPAPAPAPAPVPAPAPAPAPAPGIDPNSLPTLAFGETNHAVADLQRFLNAYNWRPVLPLLPVTGYYGPSTAAVLHAAGKQIGVQGDTDGKNFGPHFHIAFAKIGFKG